MNLFSSVSRTERGMFSQPLSKGEYLMRRITGVHPYFKKPKAVFAFTRESGLFCCLIWALL